MGIFSADTGLRWLMGVRGDAFMVLIRNTPLDPLDRGFYKHVLHGRVLCGITPC